MPDDKNIIEPRVSVQVEPLLLRRVDAARVLSVSPRLFDDLVLAGLIGKVRIGGVVAFALEELRAFVRQAKRENYDSSKIHALIEKSKSQRNSLRQSPAKSSPGQETRPSLSVPTSPS